jgi:hypothetical protein
MVFRALALSLLLTSMSAYTQGRKPAVEDFVGIEMEQVEKATPNASDALYNLEQDLNKIDDKKNKSSQKIASTPISSPTQWSTTAMVGIALLLGLPMFVWFMVMNHLKKKAYIENSSNIEVLEKYRKEREQKIEDSIRKAS